MESLHLEIVGIALHLDLLVVPSSSFPFSSLQSWACRGDLAIGTCPTCFSSVSRSPSCRLFRKETKKLTRPPLVCSARPPLPQLLSPNLVRPRSLLLISSPRPSKQTLKFSPSSCSYQTKTFLSYSTRFLWDHPDGPKRVIPHFYAEGMLDPSSSESTDKLCELHGWKRRKENDKVDIWDAVLFVSPRRRSVAGLEGEGRKETSSSPVSVSLFVSSPCLSQSTELDLLEVRLAEIDPFVDMFIVVES